MFIRHIMPQVSLGSSFFLDVKDPNVHDPNARVIVIVLLMIGAGPILKSKQSAGYVLVDLVDLVVLSFPVVLVNLVVLDHRVFLIIVVPAFIIIIIIIIINVSASK